MAETLRIAVKVEGLGEAQEKFRALPAKVQKRILQPAVAAALRPVVKAARAELRAGLAARRGKRWKKSLSGELLRSIGAKAIAVRGKPEVIGKVGTMAYRGEKEQSGGYYGWLVEHGHDLVRGGTLERPGRKAGIAAAAKRWLLQLGFAESRTPLKHPKGGRTLSLKKRGYQYTGAGLVGFQAGGYYSFGEKFRGRQLRGGGKIAGRVPGYPFLKPAWDRSQNVVRGMLRLEIEDRVDEIVNRKS